jgi:hypothetical protein
MEWEYKTVKVRPQGFFGGIVDEAQLDAVLNGLGRDEWELTTSFATHEGYGRTRDVVLMFKKPRSTQSKGQ